MMSDLLLEAVQQSPVPVMIADRKGNIQYVNERFSVLTGYRSEEIIGKNPRVLSAGKTPQEVYRELWETLLSGRVWHGDLCNKRKSGEVFWESISIGPIKNREGIITHFVGIWQDNTRHKRIDEKLAEDLREYEDQSKTDDLTRQYNRRHILAELDQELERALRYGRSLSGMMADIDDFKMINDRYGHLIGDRVIRAFATVLHRSIRKIDILGRYGGDEFLVILPEATLETAKFVASRIQKSLRDYHDNVLGDLSPFTASIGLISFDNIREMDKTIFIEKMDQAMFRAKRTGKNRVLVV